MNTKAQRKAKELARLQRRADAWYFRTREFLTEAEIAARLKVSQSTISRDLQFVANRVLGDLDELVAQTQLEQVAQLQFMTRELVQAWLASKENARQVTRVIKMGGSSEDDEEEEDGEGDKSITTRVTGQTGSVAYLNSAMRAMADVRRILGADAPLQQDITIKSELEAEKIYPEMDDEELLNMIAKKISDDGDMHGA